MTKISTYYFVFITVTLNLIRSHPTTNDNVAGSTCIRLCISTTSVQNAKGGSLDFNPIMQEKLHKTKKTTTKASTVKEAGKGIETYKAVLRMETKKRWYH